jgi:hypothetical protein
MTVRGAAFLGIGAMVGAAIFAFLGEAGTVAGSAVGLSFPIADEGSTWPSECDGQLDQTEAWRVRHPPTSLA